VYDSVLISVIHSLRLSYYPLRVYDSVQISVIHSLRLSYYPLQVYDKWQITVLHSLRIVFKPLRVYDGFQREMEGNKRKLREIHWEMEGNGDCKKERIYRILILFRGQFINCSREFLTVPELFQRKTLHTYCMKGFLLFLLPLLGSNQGPHD
jgi:hypothetical protein